MKSAICKISVAITATALAFYLSACSDDGSGTTNVSHGEFSVPIPEGLADDSTDVDSSSDEKSSSSKTKGESSESKSSSSKTITDTIEIKYDTTWAKDDIDSTSNAKSSSSEAKPESSSAKSSSSEAKPESSSVESSERQAVADAAGGKEACTDKQAADDLKENSPHGHFGNCGEWAQNTGPNVSLSATIDTVGIAKRYLDMMWDEKKLVESGERDPAKDDDYSYIGHYLNMRNTKYKTVACGFATSSDGKKGWLNVNFF